MNPRPLILLALVASSRLVAADAKAPAAPPSTPPPAAAAAPAANKAAPATTPTAAPAAANNKATTPVAAPAAKAAPTAGAPKAGAAAGGRATAAPERESALTPKGTLDTFRIVSDRNIFNPNRVVRRERPAEEPVQRAETIALVGTVQSPNGVLAFFNSADTPSHRKTLKVGESVGPFKVTRIATDGIDVERDGKSMPVRVGQALRKPEGGDWGVTGSGVMSAVNGATGGAAASTAGAAGATSSRTPEAAARPDPTAVQAIPADADEVTRRLMERRQKQQKN